MKASFIISVLIFWKAHVCSSTRPTCPPQNGPGGAIHFSHATNCAKFVTCDWGKEVIRNCAPGTLWNDFVKTCDHPRNVQCNAVATDIRTSSMRPYRTIPPMTPTTTVAYSTIPPRQPSTNGTCPSVVDPKNPVFMPHFDCARFYVCTAKGPVELQCNEGYHWSIKTNHCERPWEAWCVTSTAPPTANDGCPSVVDPDNPIFLPHPDSTKIYICITGIGRTELSCPEGLHWSPDGCVARTDSSMSSTAPGSTATPQSTSTASTYEPTQAEEYFTTDVYN